MSGRMQMLVDGEWVDVTEARDFTFEPSEQEATISEPVEPMRTSWSMSVDIEPEGAEALREIIERAEREARAERWRRRLWLRYPYRPRGAH